MALFLASGALHLSRILLITTGYRWYPELQFACLGYDIRNLPADDRVGTTPEYQYLTSGQYAVLRVRHYASKDPQAVRRNTAGTGFLLEVTR